VTTKIKIKVGEVEIEYEGPEAFLLKSLPGLIARLSGMSDETPKDGTHGKGKKENKVKTEKGGPLPDFLRAKKATDNQSKKFLATAVWLHNRGAARITTADVRKALKDSLQGKLGNPAQCLNNNVSSGYAEKEGKAFFVTDTGRSSLN
jgi:hypothetical protein